MKFLSEKGKNETKWGKQKIENTLVKLSISTREIILGDGKIEF